MDPTVTPPIGTGAILATGVMEPVRPTWNSTLSSPGIQHSAAYWWPAGL